MLLFFLESASYNVGYAIGQVIGVLILLAIPLGIGYVIYRLVRKKPAPAEQPKTTYDYGLERMTPQAGPCPGCGKQHEAQEVYCGNCGRQLQPIP